MKRELLAQLLQSHREEAKADDRGCFSKAMARGQQTFTLVEQDKSAPKTIIFWIGENIETAPAEMLMDALLDAIVMREQPNRKNAD